MKPEVPKSMQRRITVRIVIGGDHHDRDARVLRAQIDQAGETPHAGHVQVEQDEVDLAAAFEKLCHVLEGAGFADLDMLEKAADRLPQRPAE